MGVRIYYDNNLLYSTKIENLKLVSPKTTQEVNKSGSLTFTIYPDHPYYDVIERFKGLVTVYDDGISEPLFRGRIIKDDKGFYNQRNITCEGELAFLLDSIQRPYSFKGTPGELFEKYISVHNSQVDSTRQFTVGNVTVTDPNDYIVRSNTDYESTWKEINDKLIKNLGGYLWVRHEGGINYIDYLADFTTLSNQKIEFGKNLLDIKQMVSAENFYTAVIPLGALNEDTGLRVDIKSENGNVDYVYNEEAVTKYGYIFTTKTWDDVTEPANLKRKAQQYIDDLARFTASISIAAADLNGTGVDVNSFRIGRYIETDSNPHEISQKLICTKLVRQLDNPAATKLTLGAKYYSLTEAQSNARKDISEAIKRIDYTESKLISLEAGAVMVSPYEPDSHNVLWLDTSISPPPLKRWDPVKEVWNIVNDMTDIIYELRKEFNSSIYKSESNIMTTVAENYYLKSETDSLVSSVSTSLTEKSDRFEMMFSAVNSDIKDVISDTDAEFSEIKKYIRFIDGKIILGQIGNQLELKIANDRISFIQNNSEVAYFSNNKLNVTDGEFINSLRLGNFAFSPRTNGNLSFSKVN